MTFVGGKDFTLQCKTSVKYKCNSLGNLQISWVKRFPFILILLYQACRSSLTIGYSNDKTLPVYNKNKCVLHFILKYKYSQLYLPAVFIPYLPISLPSSKE